MYWLLLGKLYYLCFARRTLGFLVLAQLPDCEIFGGAVPPLDDTAVKAIYRNNVIMLIVCLSIKEKSRIPFLIPTFSMTTRVFHTSVLHRVYKKKLNKFEIALNVAKRFKV